MEIFTKAQWQPGELLHFKTAQAYYFSADEIPGRLQYTPRLDTEVSRIEIRRQFYSIGSEFNVRLAWIYGQKTDVVQKTNSVVKRPKFVEADEMHGRERIDQAIRARDYAIALSESFCKDFEACTGTALRLSFLRCETVLIDDVWHIREEYLDGDWKKWVHAKGETLDADPIIDALAHHTWKGGHALLLDLQGVVKDGVYTLTDACVTLRDPNERKWFTSSNHGEQAIQKFLMSHQCNNYCELLKLGKLHPKP